MTNDITPTSIEDVIILLNSVKNQEEASRLCEKLSDNLTAAQLNDLDLSNVNIPYVRLMVQETIDTVNTVMGIKFAMLP